MITEPRPRAKTGLLGFLLTLLACIYRVVLWGHRLCYDRGWFSTHDLHRPVISVGNLTAGGVGKTPLIKTLIRHLLQNNIRPAVLMRGYHSRRSEGTLQSDEALDYLQEFPGVPVLPGRRRVQTARDFLRQQDADVFLMDDGFQHRCVKRDLDIVILDATNPFGNGAVLPRGVLRESVVALRRADIIVLTKTDLGRERIPQIKKVLTEKKISCPVFQAVHQPRHFLDWRMNREITLTEVMHQSACLLSAIGDPSGFERMIASLGVTVKKHYIFPDHHWFTKNDWLFVLADCQRQEVGILITTSKDAVRLSCFQEKIPDSLAVYIFHIELMINHEQQDFFKRIDRVLQR